MVGGWRGRSRFKPKSKNSLEPAWIARLKCESRETKRSMKPVRCVRAAASGASAPDTGSAERGGRVLPAAGLAHFFCPNGAVEKARAGSNERMECIGANERKGCMCAVVKRCGVKRNTAATTWICRVGKDIYPESEMSGMERNERMNDSSCVRLAIAV